jgi:AraC-like DNA-binding protein
MLGQVDYREIEPPESLRPLVKCGWTLGVPLEGPAWTTHRATPDGCMEIIRRLSGRSRWNGEQPDSFVAGAITTPAELELGAGSRFVALRIWPWTWRLISGRSLGDLADRWAPLEKAAPDFAMPGDIGTAMAALHAVSPTPAMLVVAGALAIARAPRDLVRLTGMSPRALQRWFEEYVGQPPRTYLRMVRFGEALAELPKTAGGLAGMAAAHGFADQSHMAREFRELAGTPARAAKVRAQGPFLSGK